MAFALTLFVETANLRLTHPNLISSPTNDHTCRQLYDQISKPPPPAAAGEQRCTDPDCPGPHENTAPDHTSISPEPSDTARPTLYQAFHAVCSFYAGDLHQRSLCARVLAFYLLTEQSRGAVLEPWILPSADDPHSPDLVRLHPAVVQALADVSLTRTAVLPADLFLQRIALKAAAMPKRPGSGTDPGKP